MNWSIRYANNSTGPKRKIFDVRNLKTPLQDGMAKTFRGEGGSEYTKLQDGTWHRAISPKHINDPNRQGMYLAAGHTAEHTVFIHPDVASDISLQAALGGREHAGIVRHTQNGQVGASFRYQKGKKQNWSWEYLGPEHVSAEPKVGWTPLQFGKMTWDNGVVKKGIHPGTKVSEVGY